MKLLPQHSTAKPTYSYALAVGSNQSMLKGLWKMITKPHDGTRSAVLAEVVVSRATVQHAANRFETTVQELLDRNDRLTGRKNENRNPL